MNKGSVNIGSLPLSWIYNDETNKINSVKLGKSIYWIYTGKIWNMSIIQLLGEQFSNHKIDLLIRGCNKHTVDNLNNFNFHSIIIGKEAIIELHKNPFQKKSLKKLVKRGLKFGFIEEIQYSKESVRKLENLKAHSAHSNEPQLKYLFIDQFSKETRLFAFINKSNNWEGAILLSRNSENKIQAELLLRRKSAPNGAMEALIQHVYQILKTEKYSEFSLGEVPFIIKSSELSFFSKEYLINKIGKLLKYAYNYEGLYFFKDKFTTRWDKIYLCSRNKAKLKNIFFIAIKSNLFLLAMKKIIK